MCEGVDEDLRHGAWNVDIRVVLHILYGMWYDVWLPLHVHLGGK